MYERMESVLRRLDFEEGDASFRWHRPKGQALTVEFFCPASEKRPAGRAFRPKAAENPTGKFNLGGKLAALALDAGSLLTTDLEIVTRPVALPNNKGTIEAELRVTGPLAFLAAKADALRKRDKPKDAYDIVLADRELARRSHGCGGGICRTRDLPFSRGHHCHARDCRRLLIHAPHRAAQLCALRGGGRLAGGSAGTARSRRYRRVHGRLATADPVRPHLIGPGSAPPPTASSTPRCGNHPGPACTCRRQLGST